MAKKDAKIDPRLDAIRYQEMLRQVGAKKRATEPQAKEEVDKLAKAVAALRQIGASKPEVETELDKANAALRDKDWTTAFNVSEGGRAIAERIADGSAQEIVDAAVAKMYDVSSVGAAVEELQPLAQAARRLMDERRFVEAIRKAQELRAKTAQAGKAYLEEAVHTFEELIQHDREGGTDTRSPEAILERAKTMLVGGEVDFRQVADLVLQAQSARESALRGEPAGYDETPTMPMEAEDRAAVTTALEQSFREAEQAIQTAQALKSNVQVAERELARAKSAFDAGDLKAARVAARRSIVAAQSSARKAVLALLQDAGAESRRLRLAGANVTEVRKLLATAKARTAEGSFREAAELLRELTTRAQGLREEQQKMLKEVEDTHQSLLKITSWEVVPTDALEPLEDARNYARRGDVERARTSLQRAERAGREFWSTVVDTVVKNQREFVLEARDANAPVNNARLKLNEAKQALNEGNIAAAVAAAFAATSTLEGTKPQYLEALNLAAEKSFILEVANRLGVMRADDQAALKKSHDLRSGMGKNGPKPDAAYEKDLAEHAKLLDKINYDFAAEQARFEKVIRQTLASENEVEEGKKIGTDMSNAEELLFDARSMLTKRKFDDAERALKQIAADITQRKDARIDELLRDADTDLKHMRASGVYVDDVDREVREARQQHANRNYEVAVDLIQDAVSVALERQQDLEAARREVQKAESLIEQGSNYAADMSVATALLDEARQMSREHDDRTARVLAEQAVGEAQTSLAKFIDLILEETVREVAQAEAEYGESTEWGERLKEAHRLREEGEVGEALVTARAVTNSVQMATQTIGEIRQKIALVESYIAWVTKYTKTVAMPNKLLEHAKERLSSFSLEAAREAVNEALSKAEEAQRQFLRTVHSEAFELIDEFEEKGILLTGPRNRMMQAQGLLESKSFEESYKIAIQAQEEARKSFDIFQKTQRAVGALETEVQRLEGFGIAVKALTDLLETASASFASENYEAANVAVQQAQALVPKLKQERTQALEDELRAAVQAAKGKRGLNMKKFDDAFAHCIETRKEGDVGLSIEMFAETKRDLDAAVAESTALEGLFDEAGRRAEELGRIQLDGKAMADARAFAQRRADALDVKEATRLLKRALKQAERDLEGAAQSRLDSVSFEAAALGAHGVSGEAAVPQVVEAAGLILQGRYADAVAICLAAQAALKAVPERAGRVSAELARARTCQVLLREAYGQPPQQSQALDDAARALAAGDIGRAEETSRGAMAAVAQALAAQVKSRLAGAQEKVKAAETQGADTARALEAVRSANAALEQGVPESGSHWAMESERLAASAITEAKTAQEAVDKAAGLVTDARNFGADVREVEKQMAALKELSAKRRHRQTLKGLKQVEFAWHAAKKGRVDGRKTEVLEALQRAAKLGLPQDEPRKQLAAIEKMAAAEKFEEAMAALDALEQSISDQLARHDDLSAEFEAVQDLETASSDLKVDLSSAREARKHSRDALDSFDLVRGEELIGLYRKEVQAILTSHTLRRLQDLTKAVELAAKDGLVLVDAREHATHAEEELNAQNWREALTVLDRGFEKLEEARRRYQEVRAMAKQAEDLLSASAPLNIDVEAVREALGSYKQRLQEGALEEAKVEADYALKAVRTAVASDVSRRVEELTTLIEDAAELGVSIESERAGLKQAKEAAEKDDFARLVQAAELVQKSLAVKQQERQAAVDVADRLRERIDQLEAFEIPASEFEKEAAAFERLLAQREYKKVLQVGEPLEAKVSQRMKARVEARIGDTAMILKMAQKSSLYVGAAAEGLEEARRLAAAGSFPEAYNAARDAEKVAYENKDRHDRAKQVLRILDEHLELASAMSLETADLEALRGQALDAFEFQSHEEAASLALDAFGKLTARMRNVLEERIRQASGKADALEMAGANVSLLRRQLELVGSLIEGEDVISGEVSLSGTERRLEMAAKEFHEAKETVDGFVGLIDVADLLSVDAKSARKRVEEVNELFSGGQYAEAVREAKSARAELARGCAVEVEKRIEAAREVLAALERSGIPAGPAMPRVEDAMAELHAQEFVEAFSAAREAMDLADKQRKAHDAAREAIRAARRHLRVTEALDADGNGGREMLSESELLFRSGDFEGSSRSASESLSALSSAASDSAQLAITEAEQNLGQFRDSGVRCPPAEDCLDRSRQALELSDYLGSVHFARLSTRLAEDARRQFGEAEAALESFRKTLERAENLFEVTDADKDALERARKDYEGGQVRRARERIDQALGPLHGRAQEAMVLVVKEVEALAEGITQLKGDASPSRNDLKESAIALQEGRVMDALEGAVSTRTFARDQLSEVIEARVSQADELLGELGRGGVEVKGAKEALEAMRAAGESMDPARAAKEFAGFQGLADGALKTRAEQLYKALQKASEQRYFRQGPGAQSMQKWKTQAADLRSVLTKGDQGKALASLIALNETVETGLGQLIAEKLVEIDSLRDAYSGRREPTPEEAKLYEAVVSAADRQRAGLEQIEQAEKLDQMQRDWASKFVTETTGRLTAEMYKFEDKAAMGRLKELLDKVKAAQGSPAGSLVAVYELIDAARELLRSRATAVISQAEAGMEACRAVDADATALRDFIDRANASFGEGDMSQAIELAQLGIKEAGRLQEAQVLDSLRRLKTEFEAAPEGPEKVEAKRFLQESMQARQTKEYEAAYDFAKKAREALVRQATAKAETEITALIQLVEGLEAGGVDGSAHRDQIESVRAAFAAWDIAKGRSDLAALSGEVKKKAAEFASASAAVEKVGGRLERAMGQRVDVEPLEPKLAAAREKLQGGDFAAALKGADSVAAELDRLLIAKAKPMFTAVQAKVKHNRNLEIDSKTADDLLKTHQKLMAEKDIEGAFDALMRASEEADKAKETSKKVRQLGEQGTELLERAAEAGISLPEAQEQMIFEAAKGRLKGELTVAQLEGLIEAVREQLGAGGARLELSLSFGEPPVINRANNAVLEVANRGEEAADNVQVAFTGEATVKSLGSPLGRIEAGRRGEMEVQLLSRKMGKVPLRMLITYTDPMTGQPKRRSDRRWMTFFDPADTHEEDQFVRREEKCLVCVGVIPPAESMKVCECQSTFHLHCAAGLKDCPKCGRSLSDS